MSIPPRLAEPALLVVATEVMEENIAESQTTGDEGEEIWAEPNDRVDETENEIEEVNKNFIFLFITRNRLKFHNFIYEIVKFFVPPGTSISNNTLKSKSKRIQAGASNISRLESLC